jgi:hypothetical protein
MTQAVPRRTNIPRPKKKDPKDTPDRVFNKLAWGNHYGTEGVFCILPQEFREHPLLAQFFFRVHDFFYYRFISFHDS